MLMESRGIAVNRTPPASGEQEAWVTPAAVIEMQRASGQAFCDIFSWRALKWTYLLVRNKQVEIAYSQVSGDCCDGWARFDAFTCVAPGIL